MYIENIVMEEMRSWPNFTIIIGSRASGCKSAQNKICWLFTVI